MWGVASRSSGVGMCEYVWAWWQVGGAFCIPTAHPQSLLPLLLCHCLIQCCCPLPYALQPVQAMLHHSVFPSSNSLLLFRKEKRRREGYTRYTGQKDCTTCIPSPSSKPSIPGLSKAWLVALVGTIFMGGIYSCSLCSIHLSGGLVCSLTAVMQCISRGASQK